MTEGRNVMRRMTAYEYSNTLRDLLDLDLRFAVDLPPEGVAKEGFKNNSSILRTSSLHLEYLERIARASLERVLLAPKKSPAPYFVHVEPELAFAVVAAHVDRAVGAKRGGVGPTVYQLRRARVTRSLPRRARRPARCNNRCHRFAGCP